MLESVAIIANGIIDEDSLIAPLIKQNSFIIAVDGGLDHCDRMGIIPNLIIGDLDSVSPKILQKYAYMATARFPIDKEETDLELAILKAVKLNPETINLFAVTGKRTDHFLCNLYAASRYPDLIQIHSEFESISFIQGTKTFACHPLQVVSLLSLGGIVTGVTTKGLKWEIVNGTLDSNFLSQSNVCVSNSFTVSCLQGTLMCSLLLKS